MGASREIILPAVTGRTPWRVYGAAGLAMVAMAMVFQADWLTDWDSCDYAAQAICRQSSDLLLGRWWFIALMRAGWLIGGGMFHLEVSEAHLAMQWTNMLVMAAGVVGLMAWTTRLTGSRPAGLVAAAMVLPGPMLDIYASAIMTEPLTLLMIGGAFYAWERAIRRCGWGWAIVGGLCFGVAVDIREPAVMLAAWPILSCLVDRPAHRWRLLACAVAGMAVTLAVGMGMAWAWFPWTDRSYWANMTLWTGLMSDERKQFGLSLLTNGLYVLGFLGAALPLVLAGIVPALAWLIWRKHRPTKPATTDSTDDAPPGPAPNVRRPAWVLLAAGPYLATLLINHDLEVNPRFILPLGWMVVPFLASVLAAWCQAASARATRRRVSLACAVVLVLGATALAAGWPVIQRYYMEFADEQYLVHQAMRSLPQGSVVVAGPGTPVAGYLRRVGVRPDLVVIASGWDWPRPSHPPGKTLEQTVDGYLAQGRPVFVNVDPRSWTRTLRVSQEWEQLKAVIDAHSLSRPSARLAYLAQLLPAEPASQP